MKGCGERLADNGDGMIRSQQQMAMVIANQRAGALRVRAPQHEHPRLQVGAERADDRIGQALPAVVRVTAGLSLFDRQHRIEQQHALARPGFKVDPSAAAEPYSRASSVKMLRKLGGSGTPTGTENASPWAWPAP